MHGHRYQRLVETRQAVTRRNPASGKDHWRLWSRLNPVKYAAPSAEYALNYCLYICITQYLGIHFVPLTCIKSAFFSLRVDELQLYWAKQIWTVEFKCYFSPLLVPDLISSGCHLSWPPDLAFLQLSLIDDKAPQPWILLGSHPLSIKSALKLFFMQVLPLITDDPKCI